MALSVGELVAYLKVDDKDFTSKIGGGDKKFAAFAATAAKYAVGVGTAAAAAGVALYKIGSTFDDVSDTIRVGTGATGQALDELVGSAKNIGREVPANFSDIGVAVADLNTRLGLTGQPLESMATQFLNLSRITGTDLSSNIQGLTRVFGDWSIEAAKQPDALDAIFRASQATGVGVDKLGQQVVQFGAPMRQLGFSFEESLAMLGSFDKAGVNTEVVMGSMRIALGKMARAGEDPQKTFARVTDEIKNAGSAGEANALALEMFGAKAGPDMAAAIREGRLELGGLVDQIANGSDTINGAADDTASFAEAWQVFKNRALLAIEPIATRVFNALGSAMGWLNDVGVPAVMAFVDAIRYGDVTSDGFVGKMEVLGDFLHRRVVPALQATGAAVVALVGFFREHETATKVLAGIVAALLIPTLVSAAVGFATTAAASVASAATQSASWLLLQARTLAYGAVMAAHYALTLVQWAGMGAAAVASVARQVAAWALLGTQSLLHAAKVAAAWLLAMGPIGLVIAAVIAVVALIVANWDTIKRVITAGWDAVKRATAATWEWIKGAVAAAIRAVVAVFLNFTGPGLIIKHWDTIKRTFSSGVDAVVGFMRALPGKILAAIGNLGSLLSGAGRQVIDGFINGITGAFRKVKETLGKLTSMLPDWKGPAARDAEILRDAGKLVMGGFERGLVDKFGDVKRTLGDVTDLIGMEVGGPGYVQSRLGIAPAPAPQVNVAAPDLSDLVEEMHRLGDRVERALRQQTDREISAGRSGAGQGIG